MTSIDVNSISVKLGTVQILNDISLKLERGEIVGLIGPNGAGKSTLLKAILGLVETNTGHVTLDDKPLADWSHKDRAKLLAYAPQNAPVHWPLTVERMVDLGRTPHLGPWQNPTDEDHRAIKAAMDATDTAHLKDRITTSLSGGERAGVMLARAIAVGAPYLLADEPVASLDPYHQIEVMEILDQLAEQGAGIIVVLHDLSLAMRFCKRVYLLDHGRLAASGAPQEVLDDKRLKQVYRVKAVQGHHGETPYLVPWQRLK